MDFVKYYISVYDKAGIFQGYGKMTSPNTFTMDGVHDVDKNDPAYQIQEVIITDKVLTTAKFACVGTSKYLTNLTTADLLYQFESSTSIAIEILYRDGKYNYVKPIGNAVDLKEVDTLSSLQTMAIAEFPEIVLPLLNTIINRTKLYHFLTSHFYGDYAVKTLKKGAKQENEKDFDYICVEPMIYDCGIRPVIEYLNIDNKNASIKIIVQEYECRFADHYTWDDVLKANTELKKQPNGIYDAIYKAYDMVIKSIKYSKEC